jgi:hypothetical protein
MRIPKNFSKRNIIDEEILRSRVRKTLDAPHQTSTRERISKNPLTTLFLGFILTTVVGASLTYYFNERLKTLEIEKNAEHRRVEWERDERLKQLSEQRAESQLALDRERADRNRDLEYQRELHKQTLERTYNFSDDLSKTKIQKIGEVWESVYVYESVAEDAMNQINSWVRDSKPNPAKLQASGKQEEVDESLKELSAIGERLNTKADELSIVLNKNRFWIGEYDYWAIRKYIKETGSYIMAILTEDKEGQKVHAKRRGAARQTMRQIRNKLLKE